jgi:hypothetical protein
MSTIVTPSALERLLLRFWADALGRDVEGMETNFFTAGGRAPQARRLFTRVKQTFHLNPRADTLRAAPTVRAFADALKHQVDHPGRLERLAERLLTRAS